MGLICSLLSAYVFFRLSNRSENEDYCRKLRKCSERRIEPSSSWNEHFHPTSKPTPSSPPLSPSLFYPLVHPLKTNSANTHFFF